MTRDPKRYYYGPAFIPKGATEAERVVIFDHPCHVEGCNQAAPFGFGVSLKRRALGKWACLEHKHLLTGAGHTAPVETAGEQDEQQATSDGSGDLFGDEPGAPG